MFFILAGAGNSYGGGLLCSCVLGSPVFFAGRTNSTDAQERDVMMFRAVEDADTTRMRYLADAERHGSPSLEALQSLVVVAVDASTNLDELAAHWYGHIRIPLPPPIEPCRAQN